MKRISVTCPYRISFTGGGTDIPPFPEMYGGRVINATIDRGIRLEYVDDGQPLEISSRDLLKSWSFSKKVHNSFMEGIATLLKARGVVSGRISISGDVPPGTGLGTSSSLVLGLIQIEKVLNGKELMREELAKEAYDVERNFFGATLGWQDPFAIAFGGFKYFEFSGSNFTMEAFDYRSYIVQQIEKSTLMVYTGSSHNSSDELQGEVSKLKEGSTVIIKRLLDIKRNTEEARKAIKESDFHKFATLVDDGWRLKKALSDKISNPNVDRLIKEAKDSGALAARLMGGGSEGFVLILADPDNLWSVQKVMMEHSDFVTRVSFDLAGPKVLSH